MKFPNSPKDAMPSHIEGVAFIVRIQSLSFNLKQMEIDWLITILKNTTVLCSNLLKITINPVGCVDFICTTFFNF